MPENLLIQPILMGTTNEAPDYNPLGAGSTDRLFILAHADGLPLNTPYQVVDMDDTLNAFGGLVSSPLYRSLLEAYYSGARDIWLVPVAPMSEYQPDPTLRDFNYYTTYAARLEEAYDILIDWDLVQLITPIEAPYYNAYGVDFLTPLAQHCADSFANTGSIRIGFLGTRLNNIPISDTIVNTMATDLRVSSVDGKFVAIIVGEGIFNFKELPVFYSGSLHVAAAAQLATINPNMALTNVRLKMASAYSNGLLTDAQIATLCSAKLNPVWKTTKGERGQQFQLKIFTDNTMGLSGTDYWSLVQVRMVSIVIEEIRRLGNRYLGSVGYGSFKQDVNNFFVRLFQMQYIRNYTCNIVRDPNNIYGVLVDVSITPYFGVRQLLFTVQAGPTTTPVTS